MAATEKPKRVRKPKVEAAAASPAETVEQTPPPVMQPAKVEVVDDPIDSIVLKPFHVLMIQIDQSGNEIPGTQFQIHQRGLKKYPYNDTNIFKLKKSEQ